MAQPQLQQADGSQRRHSGTEVVDVGMRWGRQGCRSQKPLVETTKRQLWRRLEENDTSETTYGEERRLVVGD